MRLTPIGHMQNRLDEEKSSGALLQSAQSFSEHQPTAAGGKTLSTAVTGGPMAVAAAQEFGIGLTLNRQTGGALKRSIVVTNVTPGR